MERLIQCTNRTRSARLRSRVGVLRVFAAGLFVFPLLSFGTTDVILYVADNSFDLDDNYKIHLIRPH